jgi:hypothetical protein
MELVTSDCMMFEVSLSLEEFSVAGGSPLIRGTSTIMS